MLKRKLIQSYTYLYEKGMEGFDQKVAKILWLADKRHLTTYGRTVTGRQLPSAIIPPMTPEYDDGPYGAFGELSRSDETELTAAALVFEELTAEQVEEFETREFKSLEAVFSGHDPVMAQDMMQLIREGDMLRAIFQEID